LSRLRPYRIEGGVPAGMFMMPSVSGVLIKSVDISPTTRHENKSAMPSSIETDELPLRRMRRRKKANREGFCSARCGVSSSCSTFSFAEGILRTTSGRSSMVASKGAITRPLYSRTVKRLTVHNRQFVRARLGVSRRQSRWSAAVARRCATAGKERATDLTQ
jgi:hypothetical protein